MKIHRGKRNNSRINEDGSNTTKKLQKKISDNQSEIKSATVAFVAFIRSPGARINCIPR